jgi:hypothetical protein
MNTEKRHRIPIIKMPGRRPATKSFSMLVPETNPYSMIGRLGGK